MSRFLLDVIDMSKNSLTAIQKHALLLRVKKRRKAKKAGDIEFVTNCFSESMAAQFAQIMIRGAKNGSAVKWTIRSGDLGNQNRFLMD
jgi:predicted ATP-dependent Lon-type protease